MTYGFITFLNDEVIEMGYRWRSRGWVGRGGDFEGGI